MKIPNSLCSICILCAAATTQAIAAKQPNIVFLFSDDHALKTIGAYNAEVDFTPNIDRIADQGAVFINSFCTNSICQPSRASILTGKHSHHNGVTSNGSKWDGSQQVFPRLLAEAGYQTALIGKWHLKPDPGDEFQHWMVLTEGGGQGYYYNPAFNTPKGKIKVDGYSADVITDASIKWMDNRDKDKPFLLMCQYKTPHVLRTPALETLEMFKDAEFRVPDTFFDDYSNRNSFASKTYMEMHGMPHRSYNVFPRYGEYDLNDREYTVLKQMTEEQRKAFHAAYDPVNDEFRRRQANGELKEGSRELSLYKYQRIMQDYMRAVYRMDQNIGRILNWLEENDLTENTIIVYSSDQGFYLGEHGWTDKRWMYETSLKMPFIISWPGKISPSQVRHEMIQNIDYAPTFLNAAGLPVPSDIQGHSLLPLFSDNPPKDWRNSIYYHYYHDGAYNLPRFEGIRTERYKLIHYYKPHTEWELFDLQTDANEIRSIYNNPEAAELRKKLHQQLDSIREEFDIPDPSKN